MSVRQLSLGWHGYPYGYARTVVDGDNAPVKAFPRFLGEWARRAVRDAYSLRADVQETAYDVALVNFYDAHARMGTHQDRDEDSRAPAVSFSPGSPPRRSAPPTRNGPEVAGPGGPAQHHRSPAATAVGTVEPPGSSRLGAPPWE